MNFTWIFKEVFLLRILEFFQSDGTCSPILFVLRERLNDEKPMVRKSALDVMIFIVESSKK